MGKVKTIPGISAKGSSALIKHLQGKRLTASQINLAKCYDCMGGYTDGRYSCLIPKCPVYPAMPYKNVKG